MTEKPHQGHSKWITTRQHLQDNPEALAAYEKERNRYLAECLDDDNLATWREDLQAERERLLANGGVEDGGIVFVSPEARDQFYASFASDGMAYTPDTADYAEMARAEQEEALAEQIKEGIAEAEAGQTVDLGSFAQYAEVTETDEDREAKAAIRRIRERHGLRTALTVEEAYATLIRYVLDSASQLPDGDSNDLALAIARIGRDRGHRTCLDEVLADLDTLPATDPEPPATKPEQMWLLWSNKHSQWWRANGWGYTDDRAEAGRFTGTEALRWYINSSAGWDPSTTGGRQPTSFPVPDL